MCAKREQEGLKRPKRLVHGEWIHSAWMFGQRMEIRQGRLLSAVVGVLAGLSACALPSVGGQSWAASHSADTRTDETWDETRDDATGTAGSIALGAASDGVADQAFVVAPPHYAFVVAKEAGSFLDCGADMELRSADADGRDAPSLTCAVTLTETIIIPAASESARLIIHY